MTTTKVPVRILRGEEGRRFNLSLIGFKIKPVRDWVGRNLAPKVESKRINQEGWETGGRLVQGNQGWKKQK